MLWCRETRFVRFWAQLSLAVTQFCFLTLSNLNPGARRLTEPWHLASIGCALPNTHIKPPLKHSKSSSRLHTPASNDAAASLLLHPACGRRSSAACAGHRTAACQHVLLPCLGSQALLHCQLAAVLLVHLSKGSRCARECGRSEHAKQSSTCMSLLQLLHAAAYDRTA